MKCSIQQKKKKNKEKIIKKAEIIKSLISTLCICFICILPTSINIFYFFLCVLFVYIDCVHGYEYDKKWYENTAVSQEDWVCKKDLYQTNAFVFSRIGEMIGTFFFGQLSDT